MHLIQVGASSSQPYGAGSVLTEHKILACVDLSIYSMSHFSEVSTRYFMYDYRKL